MARGVNKVILIGRLGRDPELRYTQGGTAVANFSLATSERVQKDGEWVDDVAWHNIVVWKTSAENAAKYLSKGSNAYIEGRIQYRKYTDREGNERNITEIVAFAVQYLDSKKDGAQGQGHGAADDTPAQGGGYTDSGEFDPNDDVPF